MPKADSPGRDDAGPVSRTERAGGKRPQTGVGPHDLREVRDRDLPDQEEVPDVDPNPLNPDSCEEETLP
jgi:hypothetical protein